MFVTSYTPFGADGIIIRVEADIRRGIPGVDITGLAQGAVKEARERVRAAFRNSGFPFPHDRVLINLAPAGVRKDGAALDLPIALAVMAAAGLVPPPDSLMVLGELELSGRLRPVRGVLAAAAAGLESGIRGFIVPAGNAAEARILAGNVAAASTLADAVQALTAYSHTGVMPACTGEVSAIAGNGTGEEAPPDEDAVLSAPFDDERAGGASAGAMPRASVGIAPRASPAAPPFAAKPAPFAGDFAEVRGQGRYKRALEIAAAGGHNLLAFGPPGAGKTMLARRLPSIMPPLLPEEAVEVTRLHSLAGQLPPDAGLIATPPFRSPHHSASAEGILGGGKSVRPGEISLAHFGVLFLDEAPEFRANVLQALREPLEDRVISISRAEGPLRLPADFQLVLAANPCPCGKLGMRAPVLEASGMGSAACFCSPEEIHRYWRKFGGALLDRVELRVVVGSAGALLAGKSSEETSEKIAERVRRAQEIQRERFKGTPIRRNSRMTPALIERHCALSSEAEAAFSAASAKLGFSGRGYHAALRLSRTIADLEGSDAIQTVHILEAVQHRRLGDDPYDVFG